jgi:hypothetical protein
VLPFQLHLRQYVWFVCDLRLAPPPSFLPLQAILSKQRAETLSSVLYPDDRTYEGKELRLKQQHFFVSATVQVSVSHSAGGTWLPRCRVVVCALAGLVGGLRAMHSTTCSGSFAADQPHWHDC